MYFSRHPVTRPTPPTSSTGDTILTPSELSPTVHSVLSQDARRAPISLGATSGSPSRGRDPPQRSRVSRRTFSANSNLNVCSCREARKAGGQWLLLCLVSRNHRHHLTIPPSRSEGWKPECQHVPPNTARSVGPQLSLEALGTTGPHPGLRARAPQWLLVSPSPVTPSSRWPKPP